MAWLSLFFTLCCTVFAADTPLDTLDPHVQTTFQTAEAALAEGRFEDALASFEVVLQQAPEFDRAWRRSCGALLALDKLPEALANCQKAVDLRASVENQTALAIVLTKRRNADIRAHEILDRVLDEVPDYIPAWQARCTLHLYALQIDDLGRCVENLERLAPDSPAIALFSALTAARAGDRTRAESLLEQAQTAGVSEDLIQGARVAMRALENRTKPARGAQESARSDSGFGTLIPILILGLASLLIAVLALTDRSSGPPSSHPPA